MTTARAARIACGVGGTAIVVVAATAPALAHDTVIGGSPADSEVVTSFPSTLELEFSINPKDGFNTIALSRDNGGAPEVLFTGEPTLDGNVIRIDVPATLEAEPGLYRIGFQIISSDGHATKGMTSFTYDPQGGVLAQQQEAPAAANGEDAQSMRWLFALLGVLAVGGAAMAAVSRQKNNKRMGPRDDGTNPGTDGSGGTVAPRLDV